jgi:hypothetical protein
MKLITRSTIVLVFLIGLASPLLAQSPNVAVRILPPSSPSCFPFVIKNLRTSLVSVTAAYITIVDQSNCKVTCEFKIPIGKKIKPCENYTFKICCERPLPPKYIAYVRVNHSLGNNEQWFFRP